MTFTLSYPLVLSIFTAIALLSWSLTRFFLRRIYRKKVTQYLGSARLHLSLAVVDLDKKAYTEEMMNQAEFLEGYIELYGNMRERFRANALNLDDVLAASKLSYFSQCSFELLRCTDRKRVHQDKSVFEYVARVEIPQLITILLRKEVLSKDDNDVIAEANNFITNCNNPDSEYRAYVHKCLEMSALKLRKQIYLT